MNYLKNHCWCSNSNWNGKDYNCLIIVSLSSYKDYDIEDWNNIMTETTFFSQNDYEKNLKYFQQYDELLNDEKIRRLSTRKISVPKQEVIDWLNTNIADNSKGEKMWCIGDKEYLFSNSAQMCFFFQRYRDAMKFIKIWSKWKKPINYTQYFSDTRKKLNLQTGKYEVL